MFAFERAVVNKEVCKVPSCQQNRFPPNLLCHSQVISSTYVEHGRSEAVILDYDRWHCRLWHPTRSKIACRANPRKNRSCYESYKGDRWRGRSWGCGYTRCLVHHPGKPLLCPPVSMLRIDTRIQQAVPPLKSAARYCITVLCRIKHVIRYAL